jgi:hypothetical protein
MLKELNKTKELYAQRNRWEPENSGSFSLVATQRKL